MFSIKEQLIGKTKQISIENGLIYKKIEFESNLISTLSIKTKMLQEKSTEFMFTLSRSTPNEEPVGILAETAAMITMDNKEVNKTDGLTIKPESNSTEFPSSTPQKDGSSINHTINWMDPLKISGENCGEVFGKYFYTINEASNSKEIIITISNIKNIKDQYGDLQIELHYQVYNSYPAIRKWIEIKNRGDKWLKISNLYLEPNPFSSDFLAVHLTPKNRDCDPSIIGLHARDHSYGAIIACEIPSALRLLSDNGTCGYNQNLFEWILGPNESFTSEAVIFYFYTGSLIKIGGYYSNPMDRCIETEFQTFLKSAIGIAASETKIPAPVYCTWSNLVANINDEIIRELASDAEQCGFRTFQIDAGWSDSPDLSDWTAGSSEPHPTKFPNFMETCRFIKEKGMKLGLWLSCFRNPKSRDLQEILDGYSIPIIKRGHGYGMSYASRWRDYYVKDIVQLTETTGAVYYKQDLTNIKFGDFARGHESRSQKESVLRCLRGLLWTQEQIRKARPEVWTMLSHEIYWGTPGSPCDLAAIKSSCGYHIPPNDYSGCGPRRLRWNPSWKSPLKINRIALLKGCLNARNRFYEHRGLPLYTLEYFGAATINIDNTLTEKIQDRQICSWLMGMPSVFAGDLASLSENQKPHYKKRFDMLHILNEKYGIYRYFQYSGAPAPTDKGWHWWGKLNSDGEGIVVVLRGALGSTKKKIHIPWVLPNSQYYIRFCFRNTKLGPFLGNDLIKGIIKLQLRRFDQEIIEISTQQIQ